MAKTEAKFEEKITELEKIINELEKMKKEGVE